MDNVETPTGGLPVHTADLLVMLLRAYPPRCIAPGQDPIDAHRYAAQVELVQELHSLWHEQEGGGGQDQG
jgi:hypothetical protein